jgi:hypothetical protein
MGCCCVSVSETEYDRINSRYDLELAKEQQINQRVKKLLLLGGVGAGKTTIFNQLRFIFGEYSFEQEQDQLLFRELIYIQIIEDMNLAINSFKQLKAKSEEETETDAEEAKEDGEYNECKYYEFSKHAQNAITTLNVM